MAADVNEFEKLYEGSFWPTGIMVRNFFVTRKHNERKST